MTPSRSSARSAFPGGLRVDTLLRPCRRSRERAPSPRPHQSAQCAPTPSRERCCEIRARSRTRRFAAVRQSGSCRKADRAFRETRSRGRRSAGKERSNLTAGLNRGTRMLGSRLRPRRADCPERRLQVDLRPGRSANLSRSSGSQHCELERPRADSILRPQALHERPDLLHFDGRVMAHLPALPWMRSAMRHRDFPSQRAGLSPSR